MTTQLYLQADHPGTYKGLSAQFSGEGFSDMHFAVAAVDANQFETWATQAKQTSDALDDQALTTLLTPSVANAARTFFAEDTRVFDRLIEAHMAPSNQQALDAEMCTSPTTANLLSMKD
jgi:cytochrome o ubiquinol oxidase subunit 2